VKLTKRKKIGRAVAALVVGAGVAVGVAVTTTSTTVNVYRPPSSINQTCAVDVTVALGEWLYSLPQGTTASPTKVNFGTACLQVDGTEDLRGFEHFIFTGGTFKQLGIDDVATGDWSGLGPVRPAYCGSSGYTIDRSDLYTLNKFTLTFSVEGGCYITFKNMTIDGANSTATSGDYGTEQDSAISFYGTQHALVENVIIRNPLGDYVTITGLHEVNGEASGTPATDIEVEHCTLSGSGRQGLSVILGERIAFIHNKIYSAHATVFDVEEDYPSAMGENYDIDIANNTIVGFHYAFLLSAQTGATIKDLAFTDNRMIDGGQMRIIVNDHETGTDVRISGNTASAADTGADFQQSPISVLGVEPGSLEVDANTFPLDVGRIAVPAGSTICGNVLSPAVPADAGTCPSPSPVTAPVAPSEP